jgi:hypothetical protein
LERAKPVWSMFIWLFEGCHPSRFHPWGPGFRNCVSCVGSKLCLKFKSSNQSFGGFTPGAVESAWSDDPLPNPGSSHRETQEPDPPSFTETRTSVLSRSSSLTISFTTFHRFSLRPCSTYLDLAVCPNVINGTCAYYITLLVTNSLSAATIQFVS